MCIKLLVYGTLKRGYWNHEIYCSEAVSIEYATVRGRLYELPSGIPVLEVPETDILTHGSADIPGDIALQHHLEAETTEFKYDDHWQQIEGEIITLPDPMRTLPPIDRLEGFVPNGASLYRRVLVPVRISDESPAAAWCYVAASTAERTLTATFMTRWG